MKRSLVFLFASFVCSVVCSALELPPVFTDHMVLQRDRPIPIWGTAEPSATITVIFGSQTKSTPVSPNGKWSVLLDAMPASSEPRVLAVSEIQKSEIKNLKFTDVLIGENWLCTGQSNMKFMLKQATGGADGIKASSNPNLRLLNFVGALRNGVTATNYFSTTGWQPSSPKTSADFSAIAWYFGDQLQRELRIPVGLIHNSVGGAPIEAFLSPAAQIPGRTDHWQTNTNYPKWCRERAAQELAKFRAAFHPYAPSALHEAGIAPLQPYAIRGVLWYQGESNATETPESPALDTAPYEQMFHALVTDWRHAWNDPHLPVYFPTLPSLNRDWQPFREMQTRLAAEIPNCGTIPTLDLGHPTDVHPPDKRPVAEHLAALALKKTYGR